MDINIIKEFGEGISNLELEMIKAKTAWESEDLMTMIMALQMMEMKAGTLRMKAVFVALRPDSNN